MYVNLRMRKEKSPLMIKTINNYRTFNQQKFRNDIESAPWSVCEIFDDIDDQVWAWQHLYPGIVSDHIPTRQVRKRKNQLPWITNEIKKEQNKRYRPLKLYKVNKNAHTWSLYKAARNRVKRLIRNAEISYWREQKFGFINRVDNVNWPPYRDSKSCDVSSVWIRSDEGLTLETSAFRISVRWPIYIINSVDKTKFLYTTSPPTQHHSFFRNYPFIHLLERAICRNREQ